MAQDKEQHYVPKMYLKNFSINGMFNMLMISDPNDSIKHVPYFSQCKKTYMYGIDKIWEKKLNKLEKKWDSVIQSQLSGNNLEFNKHDIIEFILFQKFRTNQDIDIAEHNLTPAINRIGSIIERSQGLNLSPETSQKIKDKFIKEHFSRDKISNLNLEMAENNSLYLSNLDLIRIENQTEMNFVTSNNPVIYANPFNQDNGLGLLLGGIVFMIPISPKLMYVLADTLLYPNLRNSNIMINDKNEILKLNFMQYTNSYGIVYSIDVETINQLLKHIKSLQLKVFENLVYETYRKNNFFDPILFKTYIFPNVLNDTNVRSFRQDIMIEISRIFPEIDILKLNEDITEFMNIELYVYERGFTAEEVAVKIKNRLSYPDNIKELDYFIEKISKLF